MPNAKRNLQPTLRVPSMALPPKVKASIVDTGLSKLSNKASSSNSLYCAIVYVRIVLKRSVIGD